jgi:hypothetical protein
MTIAAIVRQAQELLDETQRSTYDADFRGLIQAIAATDDPNEASRLYDALIHLPYTPPPASAEVALEPAHLQMPPCGRGGGGPSVLSYPPVRANAGH